MKVKDLKAGDIFKLKPNAKKAYVMGDLVHWQWKKEYDRQTKKYYCSCWEDASAGIYLKGDREVCVDLIIFEDEVIG